MAVPRFADSGFQVLEEDGSARAAPQASSAPSTAFPLAPLDEVHWGARAGRSTSHRGGDADLLSEVERAPASTCRNQDLQDGWAETGSGSGTSGNGREIGHAAGHPTPRASALRPGRRIGTRPPPGGSRRRRRRPSRPCRQRWTIPLNTSNGGDGSSRLTGAATAWNQASQIHQNPPGRPRLQAPGGTAALGRVGRSEGKKLSKLRARSGLSGWLRRCNGGRQQLPTPTEVAGEGNIARKNTRAPWMAEAPKGMEN